MAQIYRDSYGYYRYVGGQRVYRSCHDRSLDATRDLCRDPNGYYLESSRGRSRVSDYVLPYMYAILSMELGWRRTR